MKFLIFFGVVILAISHHVDARCACATETLHVRSGAGTSHAILHTMAKGECLTYHDDSKHADGYNWLHVDFHGKSGWAASKWMAIRACGSTTHNGLQLPGCPHIVTRAEWGARAPSRQFGNMPGTPAYVFIHHGTGPSCHDKASCIHIIKGYQNYHMDTHGWPDIGYNFVVGEDGHAYEARGWKKLGAHTVGYNDKAIAICVMGDFTSHVPNTAALHTVKQLIECGVKNNHISQHYTLKGHRDVNPTSCPGTAFWNLIHSWPHFASGTKIYG
ncbi:peptidoglycan-recognition protein SC2-like [Littorina saxatilis]|uniref:Uncharacterized protein n=1 Tax=Littorina saxatilis TaxID=31220 RepID=A0AAN9BQT3_9CAEN